MKHFLITILTILTLGSSFLPSVALADEYGIKATVDAVNEVDKGVSTNLLPETVAGERDIPRIIGRIVSVALSLIGVVFFLLTLYAGLRWMIAMGKSEDVTKAKDILEAAVVGLVLVLAAYAISSFVFSAIQSGATSINTGSGGGATGSGSAGGSLCATTYAGKNPQCKNYKDPTCTGSRISISNKDAGQVLCPGNDPDVQCCIDK